jgi:hypothetical protein
MAKRKPKKIPQQVTRYYPCYHDPNEPKWIYQFLEQYDYFSSYARAEAKIKWQERSDKRWKTWGDRKVNYFVAKVTIEPATAPIPKQKPKRKAA